VKVFGIVVGVLVALVIIVAGMIWTGRGGLVTRSQAVDAQWGQVQNVYQRRFDLVPNLVASVDNFMKRQQQTLTEVIAMRQRVIELKGALDTALIRTTVSAVEFVYQCRRRAVSPNQGRAGVSGPDDPVGGDGKPDRSGAAGLQ
jgi:hypothetical protein